MSSVFISYSHNDKSFADMLACDLRDAGHAVWYDKTEIRVGDSIVDRISDAIGSADFVAAIISSTSLNSEWVKKELDLASNREVNEKRGLVLPILLDDVELPGFLKGKFYADCRRGDSYKEALSTLLKRLGPSTPPPDLSFDKLIIRPYLRIATPAHSWLRVPLSELEQLGIRNEISVYSYQDHLYAYLEEDDDEMMFIKAKEKERGTDYDPEEDTFTVLVNEFIFEKARNERLHCPKCNTVIQFEMEAGLGQTVRVECTECRQRLNAHRGSKGVFFGPTAGEDGYVWKDSGLTLPHVQVRRQILSLIYDKWAGGGLSTANDLKRAIREFSGISMPRDARWPLYYSLIDKTYGPLYQPGSRGLTSECQLVQFDGVDKEAWLKVAESAWLAAAAYRIMRRDAGVDTKNLTRKFFKNPNPSDAELVATAMGYARIALRQPQTRRGENQGASSIDVISDFSEVKQTEGEGDGIITPKPPDILAKILWILRYGPKWWWLLLLALLLMALPLLPKFTCSKQDKNSHLQSETSSETQDREKKLQVTLTSICAEIDSLPLAQQSESAKQYSGMMIKRERLRVNEIQINPGDESRYDLRLTLPNEPSSPNSQWIILCAVSKDQYPQLHMAREGMEFYVSGEIAETFWRFGERHIMLSNVTLDFE